jgi:hypothetical protein
MNHPMFHTTLRSGFATCLLWAALAPVVFAQAPAPAAPAVPFALQAVITGPQDIGVGRTAVLSASLSRIPEGKVEYEWTIGDSRQVISRTVEAVYTPEKPGAVTFHLLVRSTVDGQKSESKTAHAVTAYTRKVMLIAAGDDSTADRMERYRQAAEEAGNYLRILRPADTSVPLATEAAITQLLSEDMGALVGAETIVIRTDGIAGLQALMRVMQGDTQLLAGARNQSIVLITDHSLQTLARVARGPFSVIRPQQILIAHREAIAPLLSTSDLAAFRAELEQRDVDVLVLDASTTGLRPWNLLSTLVNAMLTRGISSDAMLLLLALPVIATILAFLKQIIGITTFGLYTPSIVALSFLALGWRAGVVFLLCILASGYGARSLMRRWRLLYIPKVAIVLTVVSFALVLLIGFATLWGMTITRDTIFILLIMSTLSEGFLNLKTEEGWHAAILGVAETIIAALFCVFVVQWAPLQSLLLAYPELLVLTIPVNVFLGRWTGLRLVEYFRFREVFKHLQEEE